MSIFYNFMHSVKISFIYYILLITLFWTKINIILCGPQYHERRDKIGSPNCNIMSDCDNPLSFLVAKSLPWRCDERHEIYDRSIIFPQSVWRFHFDQPAVTFGLIPEISFARPSDQPQLGQVEKSPPHPWLISKNEGCRTPRSHIK